MIKKWTTIDAVEAKIKETPWLVFLYKHSSTCPVSHTAHRQVEKFSNEYEDVLIIFLEVHTQRELSNEIERLYEVKHESPQLLTFKDWELKEVNNHLSVSARYMSHTANGWRNNKNI